MRLPRVLRTTPFRLTILFTALFAAAAAAFLGYLYIATAGEVTHRTEAALNREIASLRAVYTRGGVDALNRAVAERSTTDERPFVYLLMTSEGKTITGSLAETPVEPRTSPDGRADFRITQTDSDGATVKHPAMGRQVQLPTGELLFVGADMGEGRGYVIGVVRAIWGASVLVVVLGLIGGLFVSRNVSRSMSGLAGVVARVEAGDLQARAHVRGVDDEYDELARGLNAMLDRLERLMGGLRHAGDAIAHDLRSPLTRLRARLEAALIEVEAGRGDARAALEHTLEDSDAVLQTFNAVLAIARLEAAGRITDPQTVDVAEIAADLAELYEAACEDEGLEFKAELIRRLPVRGDRSFITQALANLLDNAVKYTPAGGAVMLRTRRRSSGEVEISVTDTGPGVPDEDRDRVVQRFVRLEESRAQPGLGLGLSLVQAVVEAHGGRLELSEGPGRVGETGPGLRAALVFPAA